MADQPVRQRLLHGSAVLSRHIDDNERTISRAMSVAIADPQLRRGYAGMTRRWIDRIALEIRGDSTDPEILFRAGVLGAAIMGVIDAALREWLASDPRPVLSDLITRGLDYLSPILD